ncbi:MAG: Sec8 exocyst complex component-specific domain-containing protein [Benniella sp.]|nr:MAG: Sec8 exocyst complex component-specific domain-containing protein [Benniella sp.]
MAHRNDYQWQDHYVNPITDPSSIDIRDLLNDEWEFMTKPDFNPVPLALELMDRSSLGKDYDMFCMILRNIERALKDVVHGSYQGFNASIGTYGGVIDSISDSQSRVKELRMDLKNSKESLRLRHADLVQLYNKSLQYKDMIEMLDEIEELKQIPAKLETLVREKHFLTAVTLLVSASKTIAKPEMASVGALSDLSEFFNEQLESMAETLMEELHNHLYLKSPYCDSRWSAYTTGQEAFPTSVRGMFEGLGKDISKLGVSNDRLKRSAGFQTKSKPGNEVRLDDEMITEDLETNPEVDSTYYLEILVESLGLLGKFKDAMVTILQRVPLEMYQLIDKTIAEVNERRNAAALKTIHQRDSNYDDEEDEKYLATKNNENEILRDLFWTLFSKLESITQGHSTVLVAGQRLLRRVEGDHIKQRDLGLVGVQMYTFADVWTPMLTEIRCLLSDYLMDTNQNANDGPDSYMGGPIHDSGTDLLRSRRTNRDKNRQLFKFTDSIGSSSLCHVYDKQIGRATQDPLRKALPQVYAQMTEQGPSLAFSGLIQDKYAQVLAGTSASNPIPPLVIADGGSGSGAQGGSGSPGGPNGDPTSPGGGLRKSGSRRKAAAATAQSVPLIPAYLKAAQNGPTGWKAPNSNTSNTNANNQLQTSASGHQSLVRPDPSHISVLIRPAVAFVERVRETVPHSREDGMVVVGAFFDHGVINVPMGRF